MRVINNKFLIAVTGPYKDTIHLSSGLTLYTPAVGEHASDMAQTVGEVLAVPEKFVNGPKTFVRKEGRMMTTSEFCPYVSDIAVGDKVHFSLNAIKHGQEVPGLLEDGRQAYLIEPHWLVAIERDSELFPVAMRVLIIPDEVPEVKSDIIISANNKKNRGIGTIYRAQGDMEEYVGCECTYDEKFSEWIEIGGVRYDAPYSVDITGIKIR